jgi:phosphomethylpyrimidine synthase
MKITQEVRAYAAQQGIDERQALASGMQEQAQAFRAAGGEVYVPLTRA